MSANLFRTIAENQSQGMYVIQDDRAIFLNDRFGEIFGFDSVEPLVDKDMFAHIYPDRASLELFENIHRQMLEEDSPQVSWAQPSVRVCGTPFWIEVEARMVEVDGRPAILGTFKDQTDCQLMAEAMAVSQQTLRLLLDAMEDRVYVVTDDYKVVYANRKMIESRYGDIETDPCHMICRGLTEPCESCSIERVVTADAPLHREFYNERAKSWFSAIEMPIRMPGVKLPAKLTVARDITVRKEAEQRIRALSHRLLTAQEDERGLLSRELHDDLGQRLNAAKISLETLAEDLHEQPQELRDRAAYLAEILQGSIGAVRRLSAGLRPSSLERLGLVETLRDHCEKISNLHGLAIDFKSAGMKELELDEETEINLYRITQEALHNIVKHAEANEVSVRLVGSHPTLRLRIADDGLGFDKQEYECRINENTHLGLVGMAERVDLLSGTFEIKSRRGDGTRITLEVPCRKK